jgi:hypothetical protein
MSAVDMRELSDEVRRLAERLRSLSDTRLARELPPYSTRADAGRVMAQDLAEAAQGVEERQASASPTWRRVPTLGDFAVGDQVAVTGTDLRTALNGLDDQVEVWSREGRLTAGVVVDRIAAQLKALRLAL